MAVSGQLWYGTQGAGDDERIVRVNNDGTGQTTIVDDSPDALQTPNPNDIGVDTAAGFYFAILNSGSDGGNAKLVRGSIGGGPTTVVYDFVANGDQIVNALFVDTVNRRIYVGRQDNAGSTATPSGIGVFTYDSAGTVTNTGYLVTQTTSNKGLESGFNVFDPIDFGFDRAANRLYFTETLTGGVTATGLFSINLSAPTTVTQVVSQAQFADSGANGYIRDVEIDSARGNVFFSTYSQSPIDGGSYNAGLNAIWRVATGASNATAQKVTLTGAPTNFYPDDMTLDVVLNQLYVETEGTNASNADDVILVFQLDASGLNGTLLRTITPGPFGATSNIAGMSFVQLAALAATPSASPALEQQISPVFNTVAVNEPEGYLRSATVQITAGLTTGDALSVLAAATSGTSIVVSAYNAVTGTITLSGLDTAARYQTALAGLRYTNTTDNPTAFGTVTTRTVTVTLDDGSPSVPAGSANVSTTTFSVLGINDAPLFAASGAQPSYTENGAALNIATNVSLTDADNANFNAGSLTLTFGNLVAGDAIGLRTSTTPNTGIEVSGTTVRFNNVAIGTITTQNATTLAFSLNAAATPTAVIALTQAAVFLSTSENPTNAQRTVTFTLNDGGGTANGGIPTASFTRTISVTPVDDAAVLNPDLGSTTETASTTINVLANDSDVDGPVPSVSAIGGTPVASGGSRTLPSGAIVTLNADGTLGYNPNGAFNYLVSPATAAAAGASNGSATDTFTYTANGITQTVTVTITGVDSPGDRLQGGSGNDTLGGTAGVDLYDFSQGGNDVVNAGAGNDGIYFGAAFGTGDVVDGGDGNNDQLALQGNYSAGVTLTSSNLTNVEVVALQAGAGAAYVITTNDTLVATGGTISFYASTLTAGQNFTLNAGSEADGTYLVYGGAGTDIITTGGGNDGALFGPGKFDPSVDRVNLGGGTNDQLALDGDYTLTLDGTSIQNVEVIVLLEGTAANKNDFNLTIANSFVPAGQTRTINGNVTSAAMTVNGSGETDGNLVIMGGRAGDTLTGGSGADILSGGGGGDTLTGGAGADIFRYGAVSQSTSTAYDRITDFVYGTDTIDLPGTYDVFTRVTTGTLNSGATFDTDLQSALAGLLNVGGAVVFTASAGTLSGVTFVVVDANGIAGYQGDQDYVIRVDGVVPGVIPDFIV
ncbi:MAG: Ig-like domain-containing protein [Pseudomonadota bacterium]